LKKTLERYTTQAFASLGLDPLFGRISVSNRPELADYQCNGALPAAKASGSPPQDIAQKVAALLETSLPGLTVSVSGPGFLNFTLKDASLKAALETPESCTTAAPETIVIDYGGPNVAKPMHVGHLRSSIIGESLKRLLRYQGHTVIADIHLGDWGTQMGMLIVAIADAHPDWTYLDPNFQGPYPATPPFTLKDLETWYPQISAKSKEDEAVANRCRQAIKELQQGRPGYRALWQAFVDLSVQDMQEQFKILGISFDQWFGESRYQDQLQALTDKFLSSKVAHMDQGAVIVPVSEPEDKADVPPLLLQKSDGGFLYATTDMATIAERTTVFKAQRILYVVDGRQSLHFTQVFRAARKAAYTVIFEFLGFGTMNGPDNKPFKTRTGGVMKLQDLIQTLQQAAFQKIQEEGFLEGADVAEKQATSLKIGIAALKFADLQHDPSQNYQFSIEKFMHFEGKTGPYIQYAGVRILSLLKRAADLNLFPGKTLEQTTAYGPEERALLLALLRFPEYIERAAQQRGPNVLCEGVFELAQIFSRFYQACPILIQEDKTKQKDWLLLCEKTYQQLETYLSLLGIDIPPRM